MSRGWNLKFNVFWVLGLLLTVTASGHQCRQQFVKDSRTSKISTEKIHAAMRAEKAPPAATITVRAQPAADAIEVYRQLDHPKWWGQYIHVEFIDNRYAEQGEEVSIQGDQVPQLILTKDYLDRSAQELIKALKQESGLESFQEIGGWLIYTDKNVYASGPFGEKHQSRDMVLGEKLMYENFERTYAQVLIQEGPNPVITDVEFYHTHLSPGEAFSPGDHVTQKTYFRRRIKKLLAPDGVYSAYAVPVQGEVLFRHAIGQSEENVW